MLERRTVARWHSASVATSTGLMGGGGWVSVLGARHGVRSGRRPDLDARRGRDTPPCIWAAAGRPAPAWPRPDRLDAYDSWTLGIGLSRRFWDGGP